MRLVVLKLFPCNSVRSVLSYWMCLAMPVKQTVIISCRRSCGMAGDGLGVGRKWFSEISKILTSKREQNRSLIVCLK